MLHIFPFQVASLLVFLSFYFVDVKQSYSDLFRISLSTRRPNGSNPPFDRNSALWYNIESIHATYHLSGARPAHSLLVPPLRNCANISLPLKWAMWNLLDNDKNLLIVLNAIFSVNAHIFVCHELPAALILNERTFVKRQLDCKFISY